MPERRPAFVHDLGEPLRIEVLGELAHDAHDLALPGLQSGRVLLDEVEQVLLRLDREHGRSRRCYALPALGDRAPQVVVAAAGIFLAAAQTRPLGLH